MVRTILVLIWKHLIVRQRRYFITFLELILPLCPFIFLFPFKDILMDVDIDLKPREDVQSVSGPISMRRLNKPDLVVYYPKNNLTEQLMALVGQSLELEPILDYPDAQNNETLLGIDFLQKAHIVLDLAHNSWFSAHQPQDIYPLPSENLRTYVACSAADVLRSDDGYMLTLSQKEDLDELLLKCKEIFREQGKATAFAEHRFDFDSKSGYFGIKDKDEISSINFKRIKHAYVEFQDMDGNTLPENLNYTIRMRTNFKTDTYKFKLMEDEVPVHTITLGNLGVSGLKGQATLRNRRESNKFRRVFDPDYAEFVRLQWAIDSSYLELRSGNPVQKLVSVQEFPYMRARMKLGGLLMLLLLLKLIIWLGLSVNFNFVMVRLMAERISGAQELIKMVGVTNCTLGLSHFINVLPAGLLFSVGGAVMLTISSTPVMNANVFLVWLFLFLYFVSIMALAFFGSYISNSSEHAYTVSSLFYIAVLVIAVLLDVVCNSKWLKILSGFFPIQPGNLFLTEYVIWEIEEKSLTFETVMTMGSTCSVFVIYLMLLVQAGVFFFLAWYCSLVRPGKYGTALPCNFLCRKEYWSKRRMDINLDTEAMAQAQNKSAESKYFEPLPPHSQVGIEIVKVSKVYKNFIALNNVSLHVVKDEITVLLGHNGAGKTTLMSIITGMTSSSLGKVYVNGLDTATQQTEVHRNLGYCPQENIFIADVNVIQHVMIFSLLKGVSPWKKARETSEQLLVQLGLSTKAKNMPSTLSGGMKRRLQLGCALAGSASVLVLDEPTSGLDVETRRGLWDLLLSIRSGRTVLLSTHFMEEADALGDRVAALHSGTLRCFATPMHLKKEIDTGYRLSIALKPKASQAAAAAEILNIVTSTLPRATQLPDSGVRTIAYKLPSKECDKFPALFKKLESERERLGIESIGVGASTLEEVFLKLCSDTVLPSEDVDKTLQDTVVSQKITGRSLILRQFVALFIRRIRHVLFSWKMFALVGILVPIALIGLVTALSNGRETKSTASSKANGATQMNLDMYKDMDGRRMLSQIDVPLSVRPVCCGLKNAYTDNITNKLIEIAKKDKALYRKFLIGIELSDTAAVAHYTTAVRHALPVAVNTLSNALAATLPAPASITTVNYPLDGSVSQKPKLKEPKEDIESYYILIVLCVSMPLFGAGSLASRERASSTRQIHVIAGCSPEVHWLAALAFHTLYAVLVLLVPTLIFAAVLDKDQTIQQPTYLGVLSLVLLAGILATTALSYLMSFILKEQHIPIFFLVLFLVFGIFGPSMAMSCKLDPVKKCAYVVPLLQTTSYLVPPHTFVEAVHRSTSIAKSNAYCNLNKNMCPIVNETRFDTYKCCVLNEPPQCYICSESYAPVYHILALYVQFVICMVLVFLADRRLINRLMDRLLNSGYKEQDQQKDEVLQEEEQYVETALRQHQGDALLVSSVHKRYASLICAKPTLAVRGISFAVREGECFGLVGVNGAGKSTTFKMLTCETFPTRGIIVANNQSPQLCNNSKYLNGLGYCPQFFGLDAFLTGRQNMELLFTLEGLSAQDTKKEAVRWLQLIDLTKYADKKLATYSGGCSRRLSSIAALGRRAPLSLLDEPTAGVDVAARRQLWRAVRAAQAQTTRAGRRRAVLITSHSMDEMEALCARVAIMSAGLLATLGSPAALRAAHHAGLALSIKIKDLSAHGVPTDDLQKLKDACEGFRWTLKDEHKTMLSYQVDKELKMEYSALFSQLEELRARFPALVEDYTVAETTLEQVFLQYAKAAASAKPGKAAV